MSKHHNQPAQRTAMPGPEPTKRVYGLDIVSGGGWVLTEYDVPVSTLPEGRTTQPEILEMQLGRLTDRIRRSGGSLGR